jgi:hypothetical protein
MKKLKNDFTVGWIVWNRNTLDDMFLTYRQLVLSSVNQMDFVQLLAKTNKKSSISVSLGGVLQEYVILDRTDCAGPLEVTTEAEPIYKLVSTNLNIVHSEVYNLNDIRFVDSRMNTPFMNCVNNYNESLLRDMLEAVPNGWFTMNNRVFIHG